MCLVLHAGHLSVEAGSEIAGAFRHGGANLGQSSICEMEYSSENVISKEYERQQARMVVVGSYPLTLFYGSYS